MTRDLTKGNETKGLLLFALPMIAGNLFQQLYNLADTVIVGQCIGSEALAAVGSAYTLMVFLTSVILGLCMGSGVVFSFYYGAKQREQLQQCFFWAFLFIFAVSIVLNVAALGFLSSILHLLRIPDEIFDMTRDYLQVILAGMIFPCVYNYFCAVLRSMGNSLMPLLFLVISALLNIGLDLLFVLPLGMGVQGAALATVIAQAVSALLIAVYCFAKVPEIRIKKEHMRWDRKIFHWIAVQSLLASAQQSVMNFGILMIQGLVNSFGVTVMAGFAAAVKIDTLATMPAQDFGSAFSTYLAQNQGAGETARLQKGIRAAVRICLFFCLIISLFVIIFAENVLQIFVQDTQVIAVGAQYLRIEGCFYCLIGFLSLWYGFYRGVSRAWMSIVLTIVSLGTRVLLAYLLSGIPSIGLLGIWWAIPIGWALADVTGYVYYRKNKRQLLEQGWEQKKKAL